MRAQEHIANFQPFAPGFSEDPAASLGRLRESGPLSWWPEGRCWLVTGNEAIRSITCDVRFSRDKTIWEHASENLAFQIPELEDVLSYSMFSAKKEEHARLRRLMNPFFTPRSVDRLRASAEAIACDILDAVPEHGVADMAAMFDYFPVRVIASVLEIPEEHLDAFRRLSSGFVRMLLPLLVPVGERDSVRHDIVTGLSLVEKIVEDRRTMPLGGDDLLSKLLTMEGSDGRLTAKEVVALVAVLLIAGSETTVHFIIYAIINLMKRPELMSACRDDSNALNGFLEEVLRFDYFARLGILLFAETDVRMGDINIRRGQMLMLLLGSALRDEAVHACPNEFDIYRDHSRSIPFGVGPHTCLGHALARMEAEVAIRTLLARFSKLTLVERPRYGFNVVIRSISRMMVRLERA